jgi:hypothetical protein
VKRFGSALTLFSLLLSSASALCDGTRELFSRMTTEEFLDAGRPPLLVRAELIPVLWAVFRDYSEVAGDREAGPCRAPLPDHLVAIDDLNDREIAVSLVPRYPRGSDCWAGFGGGVRYRVDRESGEILERALGE